MWMCGTCLHLRLLMHSAAKLACTQTPVSPVHGVAAYMTPCTSPPRPELGTLQRDSCMAERHAAAVQGQQGHVKQCRSGNKMLCCRSGNKIAQDYSTTTQLQTLVLALAASFKAQGLFVVPQNVLVFDVWYHILGLTNAPTRRLQQQVRCSLTSSCTALQP